MTILVLGEVKAKADSVDELKTLLREILPDTRAFDGCEGVTVYTVSDDRQTFLFVEFFQSKEHQQRYVQWRTETGVMAQLVEMLEGPPQVRYFEDIEA